MSYGYPKYRSQSGFITITAQQSYIAKAIGLKLLPENAAEIPEVVSLEASNDPQKPIQFWQLYSAMGPEPISRIVQSFYSKVFADEDWFKSVFLNVGGVEHHIYSQAAMWIDAMGGGPAYHGGDYRLDFHHTHNAMALMNDKGARRWVELMSQALAECDHLFKEDPRQRLAINTFLTHFLGRYAKDFSFGEVGSFGPVNGALPEA